MKLSVLYFSKSGNTQKMAEEIVKGMNIVEGAEAKAISIENVDAEWLTESSCIVLGTPTYYADVAGSVKLFMESMGKYRLAGKLGGAFATAAYIHGGGDIAIQSILTHMMVNGMAVYSGGGACGEPVIHLGPVSVPGQSYDVEEVFRKYGTRMALEASKLF